MASALRAPRPTLAWLRSEPSSLHDDGLTRSPAERGLKGCDHADGTKPGDLERDGSGARHRVAAKREPGTGAAVRRRPARPRGHRRHNVKPGTPRWGPYARAVGGGHGTPRGAPEVRVLSVNNAELELGGPRGRSMERQASSLAGVVARCRAGVRRSGGGRHATRLRLRLQDRERDRERVRGKMGRAKTASRGAPCCCPSVPTRRRFAECRG